jgi:hypothetical protein
VPACIAGFLGVWGTPNVTGYVHNAARYAATAPSPGVIYTTTDYSPPAYFEGKLMVVSALSYTSRQHNFKCYCIRSSKPQGTVQHAIRVSSTTIRLVTIPCR